MEIWNRYVGLSYGVPAEEVDSSNVRMTEQTMLAEYEKIRKLKPKLHIGKDNKVSLTGLEPIMPVKKKKTKP